MKAFYSLFFFSGFLITSSVFSAAGKPIGNERLETFKVANNSSRTEITYIKDTVTNLCVIAVQMGAVQDPDCKFFEKAKAAK